VYGLTLNMRPNNRVQHDAAGAAPNMGTTFEPFPCRHSSRSTTPPAARLTRSVRRRLSHACGRHTGRRAVKPYRFVAARAGQPQHVCSRPHCARLYRVLPVMPGTLCPRGYRPVVPSPIRGTARCARLYRELPVVPGPTLPAWMTARCAAARCAARVRPAGPGRRVRVRHSGEPGCVADAASRP
jgi:hypothetical protein